MTNHSNSVSLTFLDTLVTLFYDYAEIDGDKMRADLYSNGKYIRTVLLV